MAQTVLQRLTHAQQSRQALFAVLIDPDKVHPDRLPELCAMAEKAAIDLWLVGGSLLVEDQLDEVVLRLKTESDIPVVLFPGNALQITPAADALLLLSLISGRNAEMLIGRHVEAAPRLAASQLELIPTAYMLIDGGQPTSVSYMSHSQPIPSDKPDIAAVTALAGQQLGLQATYLDAGSGARQPVKPELVKKVRQWIKGPLWVGGGLTTPEEVSQLVTAGADIIVVGNALESHPERMYRLSKAVHQSSAVSW